MALAHASRLAELDRLSAGRSPVHALDPRAKVLLGLAFALAVVSVPKYGLLQLAPLLLFPALLAAVAGLPPVRLIALALPAAGVALVLGAFNPLLDSQRAALGPWTFSAGWVSLAALVARALLVAGMALVLVASTSFNGLCDGLDGLGAPRIFTEQMRLLWRYADLLAEEAGRLIRARDLRDPLSNARGPWVAARLIGSLLRRSLGRAERIHEAMLCRGYKGRLPGAARRAAGWPDAVALLGGLALIALLRFAPLNQAALAWIQGSRP